MKGQQAEGTSRGTFSGGFPLLGSWGRNVPLPGPGAGTAGWVAEGCPTEMTHVPSTFQRPY